MSDINEALAALCNYQRQLDPHGEFVGVSRQALDEVLAYVDRASKDRIRTNFCPACKEQADRIDELEAENARLREAHWFYLGDDCSSDACRFGIDECISEDFEWDNAARGDHVLQISGARPVPDMWVALHYYTDAEKDARNDDESYTYTVHATEEAARAALKETSHD